MQRIDVTFQLNGQSITRNVRIDARLLDLLRYDCNHPGTKEGCGEGECGACTVLLDDLPVNSCLVPAFQVSGRDIRTVEAIPQDLCQTLNATGASQCGACTPGVVMAAAWLLKHPDVAHHYSIRTYMAGNLCRCTGYDGIIDGVERAMQAHEGASSSD